MRTVNHNCFSDPVTDKNTVRIIKQNPLSSGREKRVPRNRAESAVAEAGSRQPMRVAFTGPMSLTPSRKAEKPRAVPIKTIAAIKSQAVPSRFSGNIQAFVTTASTRPPMSIPQPVTVRLPQEAMMGRDRRVYVTTPKAAQ